jgi:hypothetical protein
VTSNHEIERISLLKKQERKTNYLLMNSEMTMLQTERKKKNPFIFFCCKDEHDSYMYTLYTQFSSSHSRE